MSGKWNGGFLQDKALARTLTAESPEVARRSALWGEAIYLVVGIIRMSLKLFDPQPPPPPGSTARAP